LGAQKKKSGPQQGIYQRVTRECKLPTASQNNTTQGGGREGRFEKKVQGEEGNLILVLMQEKDWGRKRDWGIIEILGPLSGGTLSRTKSARLIGGGKLKTPSYKSRVR